MTTAEPNTTPPDTAQRLAEIRLAVERRRWPSLVHAEVGFVFDHIDDLTDLIHSVCCDSDFAFGGRIPADVIRTDISRDLWNRMMAVIDPGEPDSR
jgi:hypothetical protein